MRPDYCPMVNEPCQSMCDTPCSVNRLARQRTWVGLTDEEVAILASHELWVKTFIRKIEEKLRSKNT